MNQRISMPRSKTHSPHNKKDREARLILQIKDIVTTTMEEAVLDQEVAGDREALLLAVHLAAE